MFAKLIVINYLFFFSLFIFANNPTQTYYTITTGSDLYEKNLMDKNWVRANYYFNEISIPTILRPVIPFATGLAYLPQALGSKTFIEKQLGFKGMDVPPKIARKAYFEMLFRPKHFGAQLCAYQKAVGGKVVDRVLSQYKINSPK